MTRLVPWVLFIALVLTACGGSIPAGPEDSTPPTVTLWETSVDPAKPSAFVTLTFSESMDQDAVQSAFFGQPAFECAWTWGVDRATCQIVSGLAQLTTYSVILGTEAADMAGNRLENPYGFTFTTSDFHPRLIGVSPQPGAINVAPGSPITFTFSEPISITSAFFATTVAAGGSEVDMSLDWDGVSELASVVIFVPDVEFGSGQIVTWTVTNSVEDAGGFPLVDGASGSFMTTPAVGAAVP